MLVMFAALSVIAFVSKLLMLLREREQPCGGMAHALQSARDATAISGREVVKLWRNPGLSLAFECARQIRQEGCQMRHFLRAMHQQGTGVSLG
jgi:hypothetical protein